MKFIWYDKRVHQSKRKPFTLTPFPFHCPRINIVLMFFRTKRISAISMRYQFLSEIFDFRESTSFINFCSYARFVKPIFIENEEREKNNNIDSHHCSFARSLVPSLTHSFVDPFAIFIRSPFSLTRQYLSNLSRTHTQICIHKYITEPIYQTIRHKQQQRKKIRCQHFKSHK